MGVSSHEMYLILKVRDEASRALRAFGNEFTSLSGKQLQAAQRQIMAGAGLVTLGVAIGAAGVAGLSFFNDAVNASMEYTQAAARTLTQVDKLGVSLEMIKDIGRRVANEVPTAFEAIQTGLYDIFSSMEVSIPGAEMLLKSLSKAAVAGSVDVSVAARATIGILNAYKLPASDVNKVNDVMFQLVRKGIGTYEEFTTTIGRSIPSAVKAGQSYSDVAGMLAFLTRNNMSAAMSSSAAARAMDALSKPKSIVNLKLMGIAVADAHGKFRPMVDVMTELREKLSKLTPVARAAKLNDIFKGSGGTIQAMRFFNLATSKSGPLLNDMTKAMRNAGGQAELAYKIMSNTPQAKIQLLSNRYQSMKTIVGDQLLPVKLKLIEALSKLLDWWNKLEPSTQKNIVKVLAIVSALSLLLGIVLAVVGLFLMFAGAAALAGISLATVGIWVVAIVAAIAILGVAIYFIIKYWDEIKAWTIKTWKAILNWLSQTWDTIKNKAIDIFNGIKNWLSQTWDTIKNKVVEVWNSIVAFFVGIWTAITGAVSAGVAWVQGVIASGLAIISGVWKAYWDLFGPLITAVWNYIVAAVGLGIALVKFVIAWAMEGIRIVWEFVWGHIRDFVVAIWDAIYNYVAPKITAIKNWISNAWNAISSVTSNVWNAVYNYVSSKISDAYNYVVDKVNAIKNWILNAWNTISSLTSAAWGQIANVISDKINIAMTFVSGIKDRVFSFFSNARTWLLDAGYKIIEGLVQGISNAFHLITDKITAVTNWIASHMPGSPVKMGALRVLNNGYAGKQIIKMLANGMGDLTPITKAMDNLGNVMVTPTMAPAAMGGFDTYSGRRPPGPDAGAAGQTISMVNHITTQEIDPEKHAADLGWAFASKVRP